MNTKKRRSKMRTTIEEVFEVGKKYTIYQISSTLAFTTVMRVTITGTHEGNPVFRPQKKRKQYILRLSSRSYASAPELPFTGGVFAGWEQPISADTEAQYGTMRGNALYNFVGDAAQIRTWIEENQLNPHFERSRVVAVNEGKETMVFTEDYREGNHAVADGIMAGNRG